MPAGRRPPGRGQLDQRERVAQGLLAGRVRSTASSRSAATTASTSRAAPSSRPCRVIASSPARSRGLSCPLRRATTRTTASEVTRRARKASTSCVGPSSQCASSTTTTTGRCAPPRRAGSARRGPPGTVAGPARPPAPARWPAPATARRAGCGPPASPGRAGAGGPRTPGPPPTPPRSPRAAGGPGRGPAGPAARTRVDLPMPGSPPTRSADPWTGASSTARRKPSQLVLPTDHDVGARRRPGPRTPLAHPVHALHSRAALARRTRHFPPVSPGRGTAADPRRVVRSPAGAGPVARSRCRCEARRVGDEEEGDRDDRITTPFTGRFHRRRGERGDRPDRHARGRDRRCVRDRRRDLADPRPSRGVGHAGRAQRARRDGGSRTSSPRRPARASTYGRWS